MKKLDKLVKNWINKGNNDLISAERLINFDDPTIDTVCFHCQQAIKKYLKSFLIHHQKHFAKTHDLEELGIICSEIVPIFEDFLDDLALVTNYAVGIRYPAEWADPTLNEAKEAIELAKNIKEIILNLIN